MARQDKDTELARLTMELTKNFQQWEKLYTFGGQDPFWPDGTNLNLVRNHILSNKRSIEAIVDNEEAELSFFGVSYPDIYYRETPPEVNNRYMARADEIRQRAAEQLALYEKDPNFQYILQNHDKVFPKGETRATKEAGLSIWKTAGLTRYRKVFEADDLVAMRRDFRESYEDKAVRWEEGAKGLKAFLEAEHRPEDNVPIPSEWEEEGFEETIITDDLEDEVEITTTEPARKPSLMDQIQAAQKRGVSQEKKVAPREEQMSLF